MRIGKVWAVYFSATGTTCKVVGYIARVIGDKLQADVGTVDFTLSAAREEKLVFGPGDLVVFGTPVYAGRVPNVLLPFLTEKVEAKGAAAVPVVLFGNRAYDDALAELGILLKKCGFSIIAAGAFVGEHSFSKNLAAGRPDSQDMLAADKLAEMTLKRSTAPDKTDAKLLYLLEEGPLRPYYVPRDSEGTPVNILKAKPKTNSRCIKCGICARVCPMGSVSFEGMDLVQGICIKCGACIKKCPREAKFFDHEGYLYHLRELEETYKRRAEPEIF